MTTISNNNNNPIFLKSVNYAEQISYQLHNSFTNGISDGDVLLISDNGNLNAHQVHSEFIFGIVWAYDLILYINLYIHILAQAIACSRV
mgnify:CR=1 FL=1